MAFTAREERRVKEALDALSSALYTFGCILQDHKIVDSRLHDGEHNVWRDIKRANDNIDAIRTTAAPTRKETAQ